MTKTGREGRVDQKMLSHNLFKILPMIVACWAIHNLLQRCLENPEYTFQPTKNLLQIPPISVSYDCRKVRFHQWKTTASPHPSLSCRSRQTSAPRHVITFPTVEKPWSLRPLRPPRLPDVLSDGAPPISNILAEIEEATKSLQTDSKVQIDVDS